MTMRDVQAPAVRAFNSPGVRQAVAALRVKLAAGARILLGVAGAPGAGKSTFSACLADAFGPQEALVVPMDGFHLGNAIIDGTPLRQRKGAPDTFDVGGYVSLLQRLRHRDEEVVYAPDFRRSIDEPVAASIAVPAAVPLIITEGNYLLSEDPEWQKVRAHLDEVWFIDTAPELRLSRVVQRHMLFGMDRHSAEAWAVGVGRSERMAYRRHPAPRRQDHHLALTARLAVPYFSSESHMPDSSAASSGFGPEPVAPLPT